MDTLTATDAMNAIDARLNGESSRARYSTRTASTANNTPPRKAVNLSTS